MTVDKLLRVKTLICTLLLVVTIWAVPSVAGTETDSSSHLIIVLQPPENGRHRQLVNEMLDRYQDTGLQQIKPLGIDGAAPGTAAYLGVLAPGADISHLIQELARLPFVLYVEPDVPRSFLDVDPVTGPLDEQFQIGFQEYYRDIGALAMWARGITGMDAARPVTVAVIDTGVDLDHPDIDDNLIPGYDFVDQDDQPQDVSAKSHGSMVAGVIGAEINNDITANMARGVAGIGGGDAQAGTSGLRIMPLRVSTELECSQSAQAIDYARMHGAMVINMSYGGEEFCQLELAAIQRAYDAGITLVAGAGNDNGSTPFYPAAYGAGQNDGLVIAVAGVYESGLKGATSNYGEWVDISAPYRLIRSITKDGGYDSASGTSFSAPFISGLMGLMMSNQGWSREDALAMIIATADNVDDANPSHQGLLGAGRVNFDRATAMVNKSYLPIMLAR